MRGRECGKDNRKYEREERKKERKKEEKKENVLWEQGKVLKKDNCTAHRLQHDFTLWRPVNTTGEKRRGKGG